MGKQTPKKQKPYGWDIVDFVISCDLLKKKNDRGDLLNVLILLD